MKLNPRRHRLVFPPVSCDDGPPIPIYLWFVVLSPFWAGVPAMVVMGGLWNHYVMGLCRSWWGCW